MKKKIEKTDILFLFLLLITAFVYISRIRLGLADMDESFYLTIPYRLIQGDSLLSEEWNLSQLTGFLLYPIMKIYLCIFKSTEGIYLAFRWLYLLFLFTITVISYVLLKQKNKMIGMMSSILFCLFTPYCLRALSYNTIGLMSVWLLAVVASMDTRFFRTKHIVLGVLLSVVVLCNPYMLILYIVYSVSCVWRREFDGTFGIRAWLFVTEGAGIILLIFLMFVLSRTSVSEIINNIIYVFQDQTHGSKSILDFWRPIIELVLWFRLYFFTFTGGLAIAALKPKLRKWTYVGLVLLSMALSVFLVTFKVSGIGKYAIMLPLTSLGGAAFILTKRKNWNLFCKGWMLGIIYAICMNLSSDQGIYVLCNACTVSSCISLFLIWDFLKENFEWRMSICWLVSLVVIQLISETCVSWNNVFWEDDISLLSYRIDVGPLKGIYTTKEKKENYDVNYENIKSLGNLREKNILFYRRFPCGYLVTEEAKNGGFSAWVNVQGLNDEKMAQYYNLHPDKIPDIIYIDTQTIREGTDDDWNDIAYWCEENGYSIEKFSQGGSVLCLQ